MILLGVAVIGPPLGLGGVPPGVVVGFALVMAGLWLRLTLRAGRSLRVPWGVGLLVAAAVVTGIQCVPLPEALRGGLGPGIVDRVAAAVAGVEVRVWPSLSPRPADTAIEVTRLCGLAALVAAAAQRSWRTSAGLVTVAGSICAAIGLVQAGLGVHRIAGIYAPVDVDPATNPALLTTFVNANHQADLFLLAIFSGAALLIPAGEGEASARPERAALLWAGLLICGAALILSLSRGALVALAVMTVPALIFAWLSGQERRRGTRGRWRGRVLRGLAVAGIAGVIARVSGALDELRTLEASGAGAGDKLELAAQALPLHDLAPALGIGRGAFVDLFPAIDPASSTVIFTHLESAPATLWVEWGIFGALLGVGLVVAFVTAMIAAGRRPRAGARRVALCGIAAVALHNLGDFSLEFLGVAAPLCALAGGLSSGGVALRARVLAAVGGLVLLAATALAIVAAPHTWWSAEDRAEAVIAGSIDGVAELRLRPLDARLHRAIAWRALRTGDPAAARRHASTATALRPGEADTWLLRAAAERASGDEAAARASLERALGVIDGAPAPALARWLLDFTGDPAALAPLLPRSPSRWAAIVSGLAAVDPAAALTIATSRSVAPREAGAAAILEVQCATALVAGDAPLAIHYGRLLVAAAPERAATHLLLIKALEQSQRPRAEEIEAHLEAALGRGDIVDAAELGLLEEALVERLVDRGDPESLMRARERLPTLLTRPADRATLQRRHALQRAAAGPRAAADR